MLVLSRHPDQAIVIGHNVRITVIAVDGNKVRLGFDACRDVEINREEVYKSKFGDFDVARSNVAPAQPPGAKPGSDRVAGDDPAPCPRTR